MSVLDPRNHPFEEIPDERAGYRNYRFHTVDRRWRLLTIEATEREPGYSMIICEEHAAPWSRNNHMVVDGVISVAAAVVIISRVFTGYTVGFENGYQQNRADVRKVLGV